MLEKAAKDTLSSIGVILKTQLEQAEKLEYVQNKYIETIAKGNKEFESISANVEPIRKAFESVKDLSSFLSGKDVLDNAKALPVGLKELNDNLKKASKNSDEVADLMKGIEKLVDQYENLMKQLDERIL
jgi:uncharacterized phage infection (PIP) family protein YhgE